MPRIGGDEPGPDHGRGRALALAAEVEHACAEVGATPVTKEAEDSRYFVPLRRMQENANAMGPNVVLMSGLGPSRQGRPTRERCTSHLCKPRGRLGR
jgi:hypothetical protein